MDQTDGQDKKGQGSMNLLQMQTQTNCRISERDGTNIDGKGMIPTPDRWWPSRARDTDRAKETHLCSLSFLVLSMSLVHEPAIAYRKRWRLGKRQTIQSNNICAQQSSPMQASCTLKTNRKRFTSKCRQFNH